MSGNNELDLKAQIKCLSTRDALSFSRQVRPLLTRPIMGNEITFSENKLKNTESDTPRARDLITATGQLGLTNDTCVRWPST